MTTQAVQKLASTLSGTNGHVVVLVTRTLAATSAFVFTKFAVIIFAALARVILGVVAGAPLVAFQVAIVFTGVAVISIFAGTLASTVRAGTTLTVLVARVCNSSGARVLAVVAPRPKATPNGLITILQVDCTHPVGLIGLSGAKDTLVFGICPW